MTAQPGVRMQWGISIPLRDGVCLNGTLYMPENATTASPAILTLTPYIGQTFHDFAVGFAAHGYPFLTVDVRGRGNSQGDFRPFIQEAEDGYDVVEWLARQPYCNGQVAMWGGSYGGYCQWATAKEFPPHLATIVPVASPCLGVDVPMRNNIPSPYLMQWLTLVSGRASQDKIFAHQAFWMQSFRRWFESGTPFKELDQFIGNPSAIFQEWIAHPRQDAYWDRHNPTAEQYARLALPILTITGIYDGDQLGALTHYREHMKCATAASRAKHYLVIGPWDHAGTRTPKQQFAGVEFGAQSLLDLPQLHREWYAWTVQGGVKPAFLRNNVAYYVTGAERWRYADTLEAVTARHRRLYLGSSGAAASVLASNVLQDEPGASGEDIYVYDPRDTSIAAVEAQSTDPLCMRPTFPTDNLADQTLLEAREGKQLVYCSAAFECDTQISGFFKLSVWLAIDQPDTDFLVSVYEMDARGGSILLTSDSIRARYRESLSEPRTVGREPLRYVFDRFTFVSRLIRKGNRLRLTIGPASSIYIQRNHNSGGVVAEESMQDARAVTVRLCRGRERPSALHLPIGRPDRGEV